MMWLKRYNDVELKNNWEEDKKIHDTVYEKES